MKGVMGYALRVDAPASGEIYQFRVVLRDTSPDLWRQMPVRDTSTSAEFRRR